jgi:hypothetical protein
MSSYIPIASQTLTAAAASVTFSSIPTTVDGKTLRDLVLVVSARTSDSTTSMRLHFNSDTGSNYNNVEMFGDGSTASSSSTSSSSQYTAARIGGSTNLGATIIQIIDISATDKHKSFLSRGNASELLTSAGAGRWANTSAINAVAIKPFFGAPTFVTGSTFALYGIEG